MKHHGYMLYYRWLTIGIIALFCGWCQNLQAEVNWRLHLGGMYGMRPTNKGTYGPPISLLLGCEVQFPIKDHFYIDTGLDFRFGNSTYTYWNTGEAAHIPFSDFDSQGDYIGPGYKGDRHISGIIDETQGLYLTIPARFTYRLKLKGDNEFQFAGGPYLEFLLTPPTLTGVSGRLNNYSPVLIGLQPSVVFKHRALSLGLIYQYPCFYNGTKSRMPNTLLFTIGVNFRGRKIDTDKLLRGLSVASSILEATSGAINEYTQTQYGNNGGDVNNYYSESYDSGSSSSDNGKKYKQESGNGWSLSEQTSRNSDKNTYFKYETQIIKINSGDDKTNKKKDIQKKMKQLRMKWVKRNMGWEASSYEND